MSLPVEPEFTCATHRALVYERGGVNFIGELTPLTAVRWNRIRDDVSHSEVVVPTYQCCELLGDLRTAIMELHILRDDEPVWQGVITRLEYDWSVVRVFAEDFLWVAKKRVLEVGYNQSWPNIGRVIQRMDWLLNEQCFSADGDPWNMVGRCIAIHNPDINTEPRTTRIVNAFQMTVWEDFDKYAEDMGTDYCTVNRDIYFFDINYAWAVLPEISEEFMSQFPRIVEYGYQLATRGFVTNGRGYAGMAIGEPLYYNQYGKIDLLISNTSEGDSVNDPPTPEELTSWSQTAARAIDKMSPAPVSVVIPANTTLLPGAPWAMSELIPGAWFPITVTRMCRTVTEWQRLNEIVVNESAPTGETVQFTAISAPKTRIDPP